MKIGKKYTIVWFSQYEIQYMIYDGKYSSLITIFREIEFNIYTYIHTHVTHENIRHHTINKQ